MDADKLDLDIAEIAARDGAMAGDKYLTPAVLKNLKAMPDVRRRRSRGGFINHGGPKRG